MIIDISSYNGRIDWPAVARENKIDRVIHRGTTKNGQLDGRLIENINGIASAYNDRVYPVIDIYKFSYARTFDTAFIEAYNLIKSLKNKGLFGVISTIWLDLEDFDGRSHYQNECAFVIAAYETVCAQFSINFGIYCNYNYVKNILPKWTSNNRIWLAKWADNMGELGDYKSSVELWQYTNKGEIDGISGPVDLSRSVK